MTVDELIELNSNNDEGAKVSVFNERTIAKMVVDFENSVAKIWLKRENELGWVDYGLDFI